MLRHFSEEHEIFSDPDMTAKIIANAPELPQCIKIYDPKTRVILFTGYEGDERQFIDVWSFGTDSPEMLQFPTSMRYVERPAQLADMITPNDPESNSACRRKLHEKWNNMCMRCKTVEVR